MKQLYKLQVIKCDRTKGVETRACNNWEKARDSVSPLLIDSMFVKSSYAHPSIYFLSLFHLDMIIHMMCGFDQIFLVMNLIVMCNLGS